MSPTFNIYVASYKRADTTTTFKTIPYCTYVVRKSEEEAYRNAGIERILAVDDNLICSFAKVQNYIIENVPEDIVAVLDDDISLWKYRIGYHLYDITDPQIVVDEFMRICQCMYDLDIAYGGFTQTQVIYNYTREISLNGMTGPVRFYNRKAIKSRYEEIKFFTDLDFTLQELLRNRIVYRVNYMVGVAGVETNKGGNNTQRTTVDRKEAYNTIMKPKWGKYFAYNEKKNIPWINVER